MFSTAFHNSTKPDTIQMPIKSRIDKLWNIHTNGILHSNNKLSNMDEYHKNVK